MKKILPLILISIIWEFLAHTKTVDPVFYPKPSLIIVTLYQQIFWGSLFLDLLKSLYRLLAAISIAIPFAYLLSLLCTKYKTIDNFISPLISF